MQLHTDCIRTRADDSLKVHKSSYKTLNGTTKQMVSRVGDGSIIVRFDKTPLPEQPNDVVCPHFLELKWATGCPYECAWCYLQGTLRFLDVKKGPRPKEFARVEKHMMTFFECKSVKPELLNAGELSDSLITESTSDPFTTFIMRIMSRQSRHKVLFLTKSDNISNLLKVPNKEQAVVSLSVNADKVARRWEKAPKVVNRLDAARELKEAGFEVRLRIDPMVPIEGWRKCYSDLLEAIFCRFVPDRITIGSLRGLQSTINNAKDKSWTLYLDEPSNWGRKISTNTRLEMYSAVINELRDIYGYKKVALCKETVAIWDALNLDYREIRCNCTL